jgi:RHS repeat-associated protein
LTLDGPRDDVSDTATYVYNNCATGSQCGRLSSVTNALGQVTTLAAYNTHGQATSITDPNQVTTSLTYDTRQRLSGRTTAGELTQFEYWPTGQVKRVTLPDQSFTAYSYDAAHRLTRVSDGEGNHISYTLDATGNRTKEDMYDATNVLTRTRSQTFNQLGQLKQQLRASGDADGATSYEYDTNGNQIAINAPFARDSFNEYDELNRLTTITDPAGGVISHTYNSRNQLIAVSDPRNLTTQYIYNGFGELLQLLSPDTGTAVSTYDSSGNLKTHADARGRSAVYSYDALGRVTQIEYADKTHTFSYDTGINGTGRLAGVSEGDTSLAWTYDPLGRVSSELQTIGAVSRTVSYGYENGVLATVLTPSGQLIRYTYNNHRITGISINGSLLLSNVLYDALGPTRGWAWSNGSLSIREYDADGETTTVDSAGLTTYTFYSDGRIKSKIDETTSSMPAAEGVTTFSIAPTSNRLISSSGANPRSYSYDAAGNTISNGGIVLTYDDAGRMISATKSGVAATYKVNALGRRVQKTVNGSSTYFVYDGEGRLVGEYGGAGVLIQETVWLGDIPVATLRPNGSGGVIVYYVHTDHLNTPRRISRPSDNVVVWRWDSDPFGNTLANEDPDGDSQALVYNLRFPGQYFDIENGLNYNYFRDYDPNTGRYVQSDPIGLRGGINTYAYALGNPVMNSDATGLRVEVRCRPVGDPTNPDFKSSVAAGLGGEHCYVVVSCKGKDGTLMPESTISYLGPVTIATNGIPSNNDTVYSDTDRFRKVGKDQGNDSECPSCQLEKCILSKAWQLRDSNYRIKDYSIFGPNSNSFARRLVESCGGKISGDGPLTGWGDADKVGF